MDGLGQLYKGVSITKSGRSFWKRKKTWDKIDLKMLSLSEERTDGQDEWQNTVLEKTLISQQNYNSVTLYSSTHLLIIFPSIFLVTLFPSLIFLLLLTCSLFLNLSLYPHAPTLPMHPLFPFLYPILSLIFTLYLDLPFPSSLPQQSMYSPLQHQTCSCPSSLVSYSSPHPLGRSSLTGYTTTSLMPMA